VEGLFGSSEENDNLYIDNYSFYCVYTHLPLENQFYLQSIYNFLPNIYI